MSEHIHEHSKKFELSPSVAIILAGVIIAGAIIFTRSAPQPAAGGAAQAGTPTELAIRPPTAGDHVYGNANAPIVMIEYSDFQCPFCEMIRPSLKNIVDKSNGQIAWIYREFPLTSIHPQAGPAANAAECITAQLGNAGFWKYEEAIFGNQAQLSPAYSAQLAGQFGADMTKYNQCISASTYQNVIDADTQEAESLGGNGTPYTVILNTKTKKASPVSGAVPQAQIEAVIKTVQ